MDKWGYSYLIEYKTLWEKEKLLVMSNFSFFHNILKSCLVLMRQNEYLWSKGLTFSKTTDFRPFQIKEFAQDNFQFGDNGRKFSKWVENTVEKREIAHYEQFLLFPVFSNDLYCRHLKTRACLGKG